MRFLAIFVACLVVFAAGCGGGSLSNVTLTGKIDGGNQLPVRTDVNVYTGGHCGEAEHLVASLEQPLSPSTSFQVNIPHTGTYDVEIVYDYYETGASTLSHGQVVLTSVNVSGSTTSVGIIHLSLPRR